MYPLYITTWGTRHIVLRSTSKYLTDDVGFGVDGRLASLPQTNLILREMGKVGIEYYDASHRKVLAYCPARSFGLIGSIDTEPAGSHPSGVVLAGIPFGTPAFVTSWLTDFSSQASSLIKKCQSVADHGFRSQAVVLLRLCIHSKSNTPT